MTNAASPEQRAAELGIEFQPPGKFPPSMSPAVRTGSLLFTSGHGPRAIDNVRVTGTLGEDMTVEEGYATARSVGIQLLTAVRNELGTLDRVVRVVKVLCMVKATPGFGQTTEVAHGCSDLFVEIFGEAGRHARSAVGMADLPRGIAVEIEAIFEVRD